MRDRVVIIFFFQAEDGIRDLVRSRGLGDVYKRQVDTRRARVDHQHRPEAEVENRQCQPGVERAQDKRCLLYTSDAADERSSVDLGGRRIIKKKKKADSGVSSRRQNSNENVEHETGAQQTQRQ